MNNWKLWVPLGLVLIVAVAYLATQGGEVPVPAGTPPAANQETGGAAGTVPAGGSSVSADVDAAIAAILSGATEEQAATKDEEANAATAADTSAMGDVGTAFTDNDY